MNLLFGSVFGGLALFSVAVLTRYILLYRSKKVKGLENTHFQPYDIGSFIKEFRKPKLDTQPNVIQASNISNPNNSKHHDLPIAPVIGDSIIAGVAGANVFHQYMCVDDHVYEGISRLSGENIDNFSDLSAKLETYSHDSQGLTEGALNKLKGHVAESHAAKHFEEAGIEVVWPETSNQEGWDLLLNGNQVNVKLEKDANSLVEHFKEHPEVPVVIPSDADNIPETAFHFDPSEGVEHLFDYLKENPENAVIVNESLSSVDLTESIEKGTDFALGVDEGIPGSSFPIFTAAFSSWREIKLLNKRHTEMETSLKNIGLDVAGIGVGGGLGSSIGAGIGTLIVPGIGTAIGGALGALAGSLGGRKITNNIKSMPLSEAREDLKKIVKKFKKETQKTATKYKQQFDQAQKIEQSNLNQQASKIKSTINEKVKSLQKWIVEKEKPSTQLRQNLLKNISDETSHIQPSWINYLWPNPQTILYMKKMDAIKPLRMQIESNPSVDRANLFEMCAKEGLCRSYILSDIKRTEEDRKIHENQLTDTIKEKQNTLLNQRLASMKKLSSKVTEYTLQIRKELSPYIHQVKNSQECVQKEARKLGRNIEKAA